MKTISLLISLCGMVGASCAQESTATVQNPYAEKQDYAALRAYDSLTHSEHVIYGKILYKEVKHLSHHLYSSHVYFVKVTECHKGGMIGKDCIITYSDQMEDHHKTPEGRHEVEGEVYLCFDSQEVAFNAARKVWDIQSDFTFRKYRSGWGYNPAETMRRVMMEHPESVDRAPSVPLPAAQLTPFIVELSKRSPHDESAHAALCLKRLHKLLPLIEQGQPVDVTLPETKGNTALHYACSYGEAALVECLLKLGANPNARTDKGATPLQCAGGKGALQIQALLRQYGATR